jgi:DNA-binding response OmpR family regulator
MTEKSLPKILIVDDNRRVLKLLELRFSQLGYQIFTAERVKDSVVTAIIVKPDLVVSEFQLPDLNGIEFRRILSSIPAMVEVPIIFITSENDPPVDFVSEPGALTDHLKKPYAFDELLEKVKASLRKASLSKVDPDKTGQEQEDLQKMTLTDIMQVLAMNKRSCTISLKQGTETGKIYFIGGRIVDAKAPGLRAEEALYDLITWKEADYSVGDEPHDSLEETVRQNTHLLIAEGLRRMEEKAAEAAAGRDSEDMEKTIVPEMEAFGDLGETEKGDIPPEPFDEDKAFLKDLVSRGLLKEKRA